MTYYLYIINNNVDLNIYIGYATDPKRRMHATKAKISAIHKGNTYRLGKKATEETKAKMVESRSIVSAETKSKMSKARLGKKHTTDTKLKISKAKIGNTGRLGKKHTEETKLKISQTKRSKNHKEQR